MAARTWVSERHEERDTDLESGDGCSTGSVGLTEAGTYSLATVATDLLGTVVGSPSATAMAPKPPPKPVNPKSWGAGAEKGVDAVLIAVSEEGSTIEELGRVAFPGNPILGEGKPENQNIALTFTRGHRVMLIDMNQVRQSWRVFEKAAHELPSRTFGSRWALDQRADQQADGP